MKKHNIILLITVLLPCVCFAEMDRFLEGVEDIPGIENIRNWDKSDWHHAANHGHPEIQHLLGMKYEMGSGVRQDYKESAKWYLKAAKQNHFTAQYMLGDLYFSGKGVRQSYSQAMMWYLKAVEQGHTGACISIGNMYLNGYGVKKDIKAAKEWYGKACDRGYQKGCDKYRKLNEAGY